jgi:N-acetylneuraminic acid mutarotase
VSVGVHDAKMYIFGGQEDDNKKLNDLWCFDMQTNQWGQVDQSGNSYKPTPRSGHSTVVYGDKMYIFGGILELTKELNDLVVFDFETK